MHEIRVDERFEIAVHNGLNVAVFRTGAMILDQRIRLEDSLPDSNTCQCTEPTRKCEVEKTDEKRHRQNKDHNRQRVAEEFFAGQPCELLHFTEHFAQEADEAGIMLESLERSRKAQASKYRC